MKAGKNRRAGVSLLAAVAAARLVPASAYAAVASTSAGSPRHAVTAADPPYHRAPEAARMSGTAPCSAAPSPW
jgi:hypothetical protein